MPAQFTLPPDTRGVGTGNPPADMNAVVDALTAMGAACNVLSTAFAGGADPTGTSLNDAAFAAATAAADASGLPLYIPAGTYKISAVINWKIPGLVVRTDGSANTIIVQTTPNTPIIQVAGQGQDISGLTLRYPSQEPSGNTSSIGMELGDDIIGSCFESYFRDLYFKEANCALAMNPALASVGGLFSCLFENIHVLGYSFRAISLVGGAGSGAAGCTGCVFNNIYVHNNFTGSDANSTSWPVYFQNWDELVINQLNIEHAQIFNSDACVFSQCGNVVINSMHCEHLETGSGIASGMIAIGTSTGMVQVNGLTIRFCTFSSSTWNSVARVTAGSSQAFILNGLNFPAGDGGNHAGSGIALIDFNSAANVTAQIAGINGTASQLYTANYANAAGGCSGTITDGTQVAYFPPLAWTTFATGGMGNGLNSSSGTATIPSAGTWFYADLFIPFTVTVTGLIAEAPAGPNSGADKWIAAIWPGGGGAALANSATAGLTVPGSGTTAENFSIAFTAPVTLPGPAVYKAAIQSSGTTAKIGTFGNNAEGFVTGSQAGTFGTVPTLTPGASYIQNAGPMLKTY